MAESGPKIFFVWVLGTLGLERVCRDGNIIFFDKYFHSEPLWGGGLGRRGGWDLWALGP